MIERTLSIIKPDAIKKNLSGKINSIFEQNGLRIVAQKMIKLTKEQAEAFYKEHEGKEFFEPLVKFMISYQIIVQVLEGEEMQIDSFEKDLKKIENIYRFGYDLTVEKIDKIREILK